MSVKIIVIASAAAAFFLCAGCGGSSSGRGSVSDQSFSISWDANRETAVNSPGGGYRVEYSTDPSFSTVKSKSVFFDESTSTLASAATLTIPAGSAKGTWYVRVKAFSALNNGSISEASATTTVEVK